MSRTGGGGGLRSGGLSSGGLRSGTLRSGGLRSGGLRSGGLRSGGLSSGGLSSGGLSSGGLRSGGLSSGGLRSGGLRSGGLRSGGLSSGGLRSGGLRSGGLSSGGLRSGGLSSGTLRSGGLRSGTLRSALLCLAVLWTQLLRSSDCASEDGAPSGRYAGFPPSLYGGRDGALWREQRRPTALDSDFLQKRRSLNLLAPSLQEVQPEPVVSAQHLVTVSLAVDVQRLNVSLLRWFRDGMAAALGVPAARVHIQQLNEKKNGIELFVTSDRPGVSEPRPAEEVIQSLNVRALHRHLGTFGITEVSSEKNVLQGEPTELLWSQESFYTVVLFFTIVIIVTTCLMVLYRLKEKVPISDRQLKAPPPAIHLTLSIPPDSAHKLKRPQVAVQAVAVGSMVQAEPPAAVATETPQQQQPIGGCRHLAPPILPPSPALNPVIDHSDPAPLPPVAPVTASNVLKPCPSPFRMKPAAGLQERRGSNVSLVLDMSALGAVEPLAVAVVTPREAAAREFLLSAGRTLSRQQLRRAVHNTQQLHAEFAEIPMNFTDPKELDVPNHGTKNRYKTIIPNAHSRVILKSKSCNDPLSSYINANYIRGYLGEDKAFIATQGPMVNTVNDFWQMAWQEAAPVIVMITKLKEKKEKCVLYWPERRGIYGRVEVVVSGLRECEHYTTRSLTLKCGSQTRTLQHYWYTSWPDHKTPDSALPLLQLMADVVADREAASSAGPVIVHCSAGIGRTGCFIAATIGCRQLRAEGGVDVLGITCRLRADRGGMIQTSEQYEFVHHALSLYEARLPAELGQ